MLDLLLICWEFFKTGLFAFGGGMAAIPFLTDMARKYPHWMSMEQLMEMVAISESTPGPLGVNMATYVGYTAAGVPGAVLATFSLVLPSFVLMLLAAGALEKWRSNTLVEAGFSGLRPAVTGLIAAAAWQVLGIALFHNSTMNPAAVALFVVLFACTQVKKLKNVHPVLYIAAAAVVGIVLKL